MTRSSFLKVSGIVESEIISMKFMHSVTLKFIGIFTILNSFFTHAWLCSSNCSSFDPLELFQLPPVSLWHNDCVFLKNTSYSLLLQDAPGLFCIFLAPICIKSAYLLTKSKSPASISSVTISNPVSSFALAKYFKAFSPRPSKS